MNLYNKSLSLLVLEVLDQLESAFVGVSVANLRNRFTRTDSEVVAYPQQSEWYLGIKPAFEALYDLAHELFVASAFRQWPVDAVWSRFFELSPVIHLHHLLPQFHLEEAQALACVNRSLRRLVTDYRTTYGQTHHLPVLQAVMARQYLPMLRHVRFNKSLPISSLALLQNGDWLVASGSRVNVAARQTYTDYLQIVVGIGNETIRQAMVCFDQSLVAITSHSTLVHILLQQNPRQDGSHEQIRVPNAHPFNMLSVIECNDHRLVTTSQGAHTNLTVWKRNANGKGYELAQRLRGHTAAVTAVVECRDNRLASISKDCTIKLWKKDTLSNYMDQFNLHLPEEGNALIETRSRNLVSAAGPVVQCWQPNARGSYDLVQTINCDENVLSLLESNDGSLIMNLGGAGLQRFIMKNGLYEPAYIFDLQRQGVTTMMEDRNSDLVTGDVAGLVKSWAYQRPLQRLCYTRKTMGLFAPPIERQTESVPLQPCLSSSLLSPT